MTALAGSLPDGVCGENLVPHDIVLKRSKDNDQAQVLADPNRPEALVRYATALAKTLKSATPTAPTPSASVPAAVPHCSSEHVGAETSAGALRMRWQFLVRLEERLADLNAPPWPDLPLAPACA